MGLILPLIPKDVWPDPTAVKACSIWTSFPEGLFHVISFKSKKTIPIREYTYIYESNCKSYSENIRHSYIN